MVGTTKGQGLGPDNFWFKNTTFVLNPCDSEASKRLKTQKEILCVLSLTVYKHSLILEEKCSISELINYFSISGDSKQKKIPCKWQFDHNCLWGAGRDGLWLCSMRWAAQIARRSIIIETTIALLSFYLVLCDKDNTISPKDTAMRDNAPGVETLCST